MARSTTAASGSKESIRPSSTAKLSIGCNGTAQGQRHKAQSPRPLQSGALLLGKLYDDRGNLMSPSFSVKNGVRYRFYVSAVLLRGRNGKAGTVGRVSAISIETAVAATLRNALKAAQDTADADLLQHHLIRAELKTDCIALRFARAAMDQAADASHHENAEQPETLQVAWQAKNGPASPQPDNADKLQQPNQATLQAITRAHRWIHALSTGEFDSIEALAENIQLHPRSSATKSSWRFWHPRLSTPFLQGDRRSLSPISGRWIR